MKSIVFSLCIVLVSAVSTVAAADPVTDARAAIERANAKFSEAFARGDADALAAMYTTDAILFPPKEDMLRGNAAIGQFWKKAHEGGVASVKLTTIDVERTDDVAVETGKVELTIETEGKPDTTVAEKYVVVWKHGDGTWKLHRDIWNDLPAK